VPSNLPTYPVPIVGRERATAEIATLLKDSPVVTIAGAGGIGKTRLAVEVASGVLGGGSSDVWFADLGPIADPELVPAAIAGAAGLELAANADPSAALVMAIKSHHVLIVLDNCEHVTTHAARLAETLARSCPQLQILATSREPLAIEPEAVYRLDTLDENAAVELFSAHARRADPAFELTDRNLPVVRDICKRLDGIALAIQLAAACVRSMPLGQLRSRLDGRFRLLVGDSQSTLPRHKTMQALIDWSYDLLAEHERTAFRRLAIFSGGFSLEAAARIAGYDASELDELDTVLAALVGKSMIVPAAEGRYGMLDSMRQYALARAVDVGEEEGLRRVHAEYFEQRSERAAATFGTGTEEAWLASFLPDLDNFRTAIDWARGVDVALAARILANLADFWEVANLVGEGLRRSEAILAALDRPNEPAALPLLLAVARIALPAHVYRRSLDVAERALAVADRAGDAAAVAEARRIAGRSRYLLSTEPARSERELFEALEFIRTKGNAYATARALRDYASALAQRNPMEGRALLLEALAMASELGWPSLAIHVEINVAEREFRSGNVTMAVDRARHVIELLRGRRSPHQLGHALTNLSSYLSVSGAYDEAIATVREAVEIGRANDTENYIALSLQGLAVAYADRGRERAAARLLGYVNAFYTRYGMDPEPTEAIVQKRLREMLAARLDAAAIEEEMAAGALLTEDAACALAFDPAGEDA
jgi:predicted ATPase